MSVDLVGTQAGNERVEDRVLQVIAEVQKLPIEDVTRDKTFSELGIDSLDGINIIFELESEFHISIPDEAARTIKSVADAIDGVQRLLRERAAGLA